MNIETIKCELEANVPGCRLELVANAGPSAQQCVFVDDEHAVAVARFLRDASDLRFDYCSNVTGIDWPPKEITAKVKVTKLVDGVEKEVEEIQKTTAPAYLEVVYHLF